MVVVVMVVMVVVIIDNRAGVPTMKLILGMANSKSCGGGVGIY